MDDDALPFDSPRADEGHHPGAQTVHRVAVLLRTIASRHAEGSRLVDLARQTSLERPTVHRLLKGMVKEGLVEQDSASRRYFLGHLVFELGLAAAPQLDLRQICEPSLVRIASRTGDTVFLTVRSGYDGVCLHRQEGSFPIRTLTVDVGNRRPLGVGAGGIALLVPLADGDIDRILAANARHLSAYANLKPQDVRTMIRRARRLGYVLNDRQVTPGAMSIGLPIADPYGGPPLAAVSIGAIASRMGSERRDELAAVMRREVKELERQLESQLRRTRTDVALR